MKPETSNHTPLPRRTLLRSSAVSLALPLLESMNPVFASEVHAAPRRMVFVCTALGLYSPNLWPAKAGADYESTPYLDLLKEHRQDLTLFSGLQHEDQTGRQPHDSEMTWLSAARGPGMGGFRNSISVDQVAAEHFGRGTRYSSITLGTIDRQSQSYTSGGVMIPAQTSPADLFARLFFDGNAGQIAAQKRKLSQGKSILDQLGGQAKMLRRKASSADNHLLSDYFDSIRGAEKNIADVQGWMQEPKPKVDAEAPMDVHDDSDLIGRLQLLVDLVPLIIQTDSSRVVSIMIHNHVQVPKVQGVSAGHHNLSHHGQDAGKIQQLQKVETEILKCFGSLLSQLKARSESGSDLLDRTSILFGSNLGNANSHHTRNLPVFLAGGGFSHGRYVARDQATPLSNLFMTMLHRSGIEADTFGQSTGTLTW